MSKMDDFYDMTQEEQVHEFDVEHIHAHLAMNEIATADPYPAGMSHIRAALAFMLNHVSALDHDEANDVAALNLIVQATTKEYAPSQNERGVWH